MSCIVGLDSRGFLLGPWIANKLQCSFVPIRKKGKLPGECHQVTYEKEYGADYFELQTNAIQPGQRVVVLDDLIATGGSAVAAGSLIKKCGATVMEYIFLIELLGLKGADLLDAPTFSLLKY